MGSRVRFSEAPSQTSILALVITNLIPLLGVLFLGWDLLSVMLLFWMENMVLGGFTVLRMSASTDEQKKPQIAGFVFIYGSFALFHICFILALFGGDRTPEIEWPTDLVGAIGVVLWESLNPFVPGGPKLWPVLLVLLFSYGQAYRKELREQGRPESAGALVFASFPRVALLQVTVLIGGMLVELTGAHTAALALLVLLKTGLDIRFNRRKGAHPAGPTPEA